MNFTEGRCRDWCYELAQKEFGAELIDGGPGCKFKNPKTGREITVKDVIADAFLQQILLRPAEYDVIATLNLNGDYVSDALAAQVGGIGIAPGANLSDSVAMFERSEEHTSELQSLMRTSYSVFGLKNKTLTCRSICGL